MIAYLSPKSRELSTRYLTVRVSGLLDTNFGEGTFFYKTRVNKGLRTS